MLFSHQYSRSFLWFRIGAEPRRDLIAVTLRGFSQFLTELRRSEPSLRLVPSSQGTVQWLVSDSSPHSVFVCAFVSGEVLVGKHITTVPPLWCYGGTIRWNIVDGLLFFSFCILGVITEKLGASQSVSSMTNNNRQQLFYNIYIFI